MLVSFRSQFMVGAMVLGTTLYGCGGGGGGDGDEVTPDASTSSSLSIASEGLPLRVEAGEESTLTVRIARSGGFTGDVLVELVGLPTGMSARAETIPTASEQVVLVPRAVASAPQGGPFDATLRVAAADGRDVSAEVPLRVYVAGPSGALDPSFGSAGRTSYPARPDDPTRDVQVHQLAVDHEGRLVVSAFLDGALTEAFLQRLTLDGRLDTSFADAGTVRGYGGFGSFPFEMVLMNEGLAVLGNIETTGTGDYVGFLRRFDGDGEVMTGFGTGGDVSFAGPAGLPRTLVRDQDRLLVRTADGFVRFDTNGEVDPTFELRPAPESVRNVAVDEHGYFLRGVETDYDIFRYLPNGDRDTSYGGDGTALVDAGPEGEAYSGNVRDLFVLPGGRVIVVANAQSFGPEYREIFRLTPEGELDPAYGTGGFAEILVDQHAVAVALDAVGGVLEIFRRSGDAQHGLRRITPSGTMDSQFGGGEIALEETASTASPQLAVDLEGGRVIVCGNDNDDTSGTLVASIVCWRYWI